MQIKRIYIAAPWVAREEARRLAQKLESFGFVITQDWWNYEKAQGDYDLPYLQMCAFLDVKGVRTADLVLLLNSEKSEGKAVEQGLAIAFSIPILAVGKRGEFSKNVFHYLPNYIWVNTVEEALQQLGVERVTGTESM